MVHKGSTKKKICGEYGKFFMCPDNLAIVKLLKVNLKRTANSEKHSIKWYCSDSNIKYLRKPIRSICLTKLTTWSTQRYHSSQKHFQSFIFFGSKDTSERAECIMQWLGKNIVYVHRGKLQVTLNKDRQTSGGTFLSKELWWNITWQPAQEHMFLTNKEIHPTEYVKMTSSRSSYQDQDKWSWCPVNYLTPE